MCLFQNVVSREPQVCGLLSLTPQHSAWDAACVSGFSDVKYRGGILTKCSFFAFSEKKKLKISTLLWEKWCQSSLLQSAGLWSETSTPCGVRSDGPELRLRPGSAATWGKTPALHVLASRAVVRSRDRVAEVSYPFSTLCNFLTTDIKGGMFISYGSPSFYFTWIHTKTTCSINTAEMMPNS